MLFRVAMPAAWHCPSAAWAGAARSTPAPAAAARARAADTVRRLVMGRPPVLVRGPYRPRCRGSTVTSRAVVELSTASLSEPLGRWPAPLAACAGPRTTAARHTVSAMASRKGEFGEPVVLDVDGFDVRVSSPERVYFPARGETKLDLVHYYLVRRRRHRQRPA